MAIGKIKFSSLAAAALLTSVHLFLRLQLCQSSSTDDNGPAPLWLYDGHHQKQPQQQAISDKLADILDRVGPNIRASSNFYDYADQTAEDSASAWRAMEAEARGYVQGQVDFIQPRISSLLASANVSSACRKSTNITLNAIKHLDTWAIQCKCSHKLADRLTVFTLRH